MKCIVCGEPIFGGSWRTAGYNCYTHAKCCSEEHANELTNRATAAVTKMLLQRATEKRRLQGET